MFGALPGLRRLAFVRVECRGARVRYVAVGMGHRRPAEVPISAATASALAGRVPFVRAGGR